MALAVELCSSTQGIVFIEAPQDFLAWSWLYSSYIFNVRIETIKINETAYCFNAKSLPNNSLFLIEEIGV